MRNNKRNSRTSGPFKGLSKILERIMPFIDIAAQIDKFFVRRPGTSMCATVPILDRPFFGLDDIENPTSSKNTKLFGLISFSKIENFSAYSLRI